MRHRAPVSLATRVGTVHLPNPVMTASGTVGHGDELGRYLDLGQLGAVVVKSLASFPWPGNAAPRLHQTPSGMINSVGLQGPGLEHWLSHEVARLEALEVRIVASIWGRTVEEYAQAARMLADAPPSVVAVEVNLSCPNLDGHEMFAQSPRAAADVIAATAVVGRPVWAKLTAAVTDLVSIARAVADAGADAVTLINTLLGLVVDIEARRPLLGGVGGGLSGPAIHPVAVRSVWDVHAALPNVPIIGVGGVAGSDDVIELLLAGASAVQIGTATFADPRRAGHVLRGVEKWCSEHGVRGVLDLIGGAHG